MRVLFYLPVVTPWWFGAVIVPMLRTLQAERAELHVMIAPLWQGTGIEAEHLSAAADLTQVHWHIVEDDEPARFRQAGAEVPGLLDLVASIDPDVTLARSADIAIAQQFPGPVRFIMEAAAPPFASDQRWIILDEEPFTQSNLPESARDLADACAQGLRPAWDLAARQAPGGARPALRGLMGLPSDRPVLALPLHYEHPENFFLSFAAFPDGIAAIEHILSVTDDDVVLAVTDHPLNALYVDRTALNACLAHNTGRVIECSGPQATERLALCADAMIADLSKSWSLAAFHGQPLVSIASRPAADWLRAAPGLRAFGPRNLTAPDPGDTQRWFGWHLATRVIDPGLLTLGRLERALACQANDEDIAGNIAMVHAWQTERADREAAA